MNEIYKRHRIIEASLYSASSKTKLPRWQMICTLEGLEDIQLQVQIIPSSAVLEIDLSEETDFLPTHHDAIIFINEWRFRAKIFIDKESWEYTEIEILNQEPPPHKYRVS